MNKFIFRCSVVLIFLFIVFFYYKGVSLFAFDTDRPNEFVGTFANPANGDVNNTNNTNTNNSDDENEDEVLTHTLTYIGGTHNVWPTWSNFATNYIERTISFNGNAIYTLPPDDQDDWNKLMGLQKSWVPIVGDSTKNSGFIVWHWDPTYEKILLSWYINDQDSNWYFMTDEEAIKIDPGEQITVKVRNSYDRFTFNIGDFQVTKMKDDFNVKKFHQAYFINAWFGGNQVAPHSITVNYN